MKIGQLTASVSRKSGGIFPAMTGLNFYLERLPDTKLKIFGLEDEDTCNDLACWKPLDVFVGKVSKIMNFIGYSSSILPEIHNYNPDLLHMHGIWLYPSIVASSWSKSKKKPVIISLHGMLDPWALQFSKWKKTLAGFFYENENLKRALCIHALCDSEVRSIRAYGLKNPVCVIPNGVDIPTTSGLNDKPIWKNDIPDNGKILLYLGRLHQIKGLINLLPAWKLIKQTKEKSFNNWYLVIAGWDDGGHQNDLEFLAQQLEIQDNVRFIGPQFNAAKKVVFQEADAFILPSFSEGLPMAVLEAWSYKLPVLITPECNLPDGIKRGAGIQINPNVEDIVRGLEVLLTMNDEERQQMGICGYNYVKGQFSWQKIAQDMFSVYQWVLGKGSKPDCVRLN